MNDHTASILVVEDDATTRTFLADNLAADGYDPLVAADAFDAIDHLENSLPDACVLDLGLPDGDGLLLLDRIRGADGVASRANPDVPVICVTGRSSKLDCQRGLSRGADDYLGKPFEYPELRLRVESLLRRSQWRPRRGRLRAGSLQLDPASREVTIDGLRIDLAGKEYALLRVLVSDPTRVFTKDELMRVVWGRRAGGSTRTLDSHACRLRARLGQHGQRFVVNVWGVGYRLVDPGGVEVVA
jgi:DNA-binding response OmpR family regulator